MAIKVQRTNIMVTPDYQRVLARSFIPRNESRILKIINRVMSLNSEEAKVQINDVFSEFSHRHKNIEAILEKNYMQVCHYLKTDQEPSREQKLLIGSCLTSEYALEAAALLNPSIVPHPDQSDVPAGSLRFVMSLRAIGEGHISSLTFRTGIIDQDSRIQLDQPSGFVSIAKQVVNAQYNKNCFAQKLYEMGLDNGFSQAVLVSLADTFTLQQLNDSTRNVIGGNQHLSQTDRLTYEKMLWLAQSNYEISFSPEQSLSECVIFPLSPSEQNGIEDARFVLFNNQDGQKIYYATYTAYDGKVILPQLMETKDFIHFKMITLNGKAVENKGMALFPKKINDKYAMLSRQDNENIFLMFTDNLHFWHETISVSSPLYPWEFIQMGNCGAPIETEDGWLVLTHGVGPMRKYCIGAMLLDHDNPARVIGRLKEPLISPTEPERIGYVPNVVYTCGALVHNNMLVIPYAMSDRATSIALVDLQEILDNLTRRYY